MNICPSTYLTPDLLDLCKKIHQKTSTLLCNARLVHTVKSCIKATPVIGCSGSL